VTDLRIHNFARILVEYSTQVRPGDKVAITGSILAEPALRELYTQVLDRGGHPHLLIDLPDQDELLYRHAQDFQLNFTPALHQLAFEQFDVLIKLRSEGNTRALSQVDPARQALRQKASSRLLEAQMRRGAENSLRWMSTLFPTHAYAMEAGMGFEEYQDFVYRACHADGEEDPVFYWQSVKARHEEILAHIEGHDQVQLQGPNVDLTLSIKGRKFKNACGINNMPDGEIYTGPVENSANGWVRYTYPAVYQGRVVEGVELHFENGRVVKASAAQNQDFLLSMLDSDNGARYLGEFAIGTNYEIQQFTRNILFDEKIGGSFHMALGASYPETGGLNKSMIHWDMICDMRRDSEIRVDGAAFYRDGRFLV
jgi:aminopeptidase